MGASTAPRQANVSAPGISAATPDRSFRALDLPGEAARVVPDHHVGVERTETTTPECSTRSMRGSAAYSSARTFQGSPRSPGRERSCDSHLIGAERSEPPQPFGQHLVQHVAVDDSGARLAAGLWRLPLRGRFARRPGRHSLCSLLLAGLSPGALRGFLCRTRGLPPCLRLASCCGLLPCRLLLSCCHSSSGSPVWFP